MAGAGGRRAALPLAAHRKQMAVVTVQVGQCGNQLGTALFTALAAEAEASPDDFGAATRQARLCLCNAAVCALHLTRHADVLPAKTRR